MLLNIALTLLVADEPHAVNLSVVRAAYLDEFPQAAVFGTPGLLAAAPGASPDAPCWNASCAARGPTSPCRLEASLGCALRRFDRVPDVAWFVFSTSDTFWHAEGLAAELARAELLLAPADPRRDVLLVGGGGLLTFAQFMVLSRPALAKLADPAVLDACRARLLACDPRAFRSSCKFKLNPRRAELYAAHELVHFCLAEPLRFGSCGPKRGSCEWMFGRLVHSSGKVHPPTCIHTPKRTHLPQPPK